MNWHSSRPQRDHASMF